MALGALSSPGQAFAAITWVWNDPIFLVQLGFARQVALVLTGVAFIGGALAVFELGRAIRLDRIGAVLWRLWLRDR